MNRIARKVASATGMLLIGDAVAHFVYPRGHVQVWAWKGGPALYQKALDAVSTGPRRRVAMSGGEFAAGIALLALAQRPR